MGIATGTVDTETIVADEKVVDMVDQFQMLDTDTTQFTTILNKLPSKPATREKINWLEDQYFPNFTTLAASATSAATTIDVATGTGVYFRANDLVRNALTGEMYSVTSISTDTLTVVRAIGGTSAASSASGADLLIAANASAQGADIGTHKVTTRVLGYNYTEIQRNSLSFTGTEVNIETYGPGDPMNEIAKKSVEHKRALENMLWRGARAFTSAAPSSKGYSGGVDEFLSTNVFSSIGTLTRAVLDSKLSTIMQHGSLNKVIFAAPVPAAALSGLFADNWVKVTSTGSSEVYGAKVTGFISGAYGTNIPVITKRDWGRFSTASNQYGSRLYVLDLDYIARRPLRNRDTQLLRNRQSNSEDKVTHEFLTEQSLQFAQESCHGVLKGITG